MHADFVSTTVRFCDLYEGQKRVFCTPFGCGCGILEDDCDIDELWLIEFDFLGQAEADQGLLILEDSYEVQVEDHFCLNVFEKTCEDIFLLRSW